MDIFSGVLLGVVQGLTEFLPVSSTGHLVLARALLELEGEASLAFDAILHFATGLAVIVYFFDDIFVLVQTLLRKLGRLPVNESDFTLVKAIAAGTVPAVVLGLLLESYMESIFRRPFLVAGVLVAGSLFFMFAEYRYQNCFHERGVDVAKGLKIGLFQTLALIPGFSRSGATIAGGMILGLSREDAAKFSFLLALPVILGGGTKKLLELISADVSVSWTAVIVGSATAFIVGILAIHLMLSFVRKHTLWPFIWYRIILAAFVLFVLFYG